MEEYNESNKGSKETVGKKRVRSLIISVVVIAALVVSTVTGYQYGLEKGSEKEKKESEKIVQEMQEENKKLEERVSEINRKDEKERPWNLILVNDENPMEKGYVPELAKLYGNYKVDKRILKPLKDMLNAAKKEGLHPKVCSAYRSVEKQQQLYDTYIGNEVKKGKTYWEALEETTKTTAFPGKSEHALGLSVDIISPSYQVLDERQKDTPEAQWLLANCYKYGFILRYPPEKADITGISYEPWHFRYVGVEDATRITEMGVTLEEYLGETE